MASKLSQKSLDVRNFILSVFRKEAPATKATLKKLMNVYKNVDNKDITSKYGESIIASFLSIYKFKNYNDYTDILSIMQNSEVYDKGLTFYSTFNSRITKKLFESKYIKIDWIIENMANSGSFADVHNIINYIFTKNKGSELEILSNIIETAIDSKSETIIFEAIIRHGITKEIKGFDTILNRIFSLEPNIETRCIETRFDIIKDLNIKNLIGMFLYKKTKNMIYLPQSAQDIFIF